MDARQRAIEYWDGKAYVKACDAEGVQPEVPDLYERGLTDIIREEEMKRESFVRAFMKEARKLPGNVFSFPDEKRTLLRNYFPRRFGNGGLKISGVTIPMLKYAHYSTEF
jgi:hypothetical protein